MAEPYITEEDFDDHLRNMRKAPHLTIDTEGSLDHPFSTTWGLSTAVGGRPEYFAFNHLIGENLPKQWFPRLKEVVENHPLIVMHHAKHDLKALKSMGIDYKGDFKCTMIMSHMVNENVYSQGLDAVSRHYGGQPKNMPPEAKYIADNMGWKYIPVGVMRSYAANDAVITDELYPKLEEEMKNQELDGLWDTEAKMIRVLAKIENNGALIDQSLAERELERGLGIMKELEDALGFNPGSPIQLGKFLLDDMKLPPVGKKSKAGRYSFNKDNMEVYDELLQITNDNRARMVLTYRGWQKTTSSNYKPYLELLGPDGRIRCNYKMHGTKTGRCSCEKPNLQQIPRSSTNNWNGNLKKAFITEAGRTPWELDYSQLEFRLGAAYGAERRLIDIFNDPDRDIFDEMAAELGMSRQNTKTLNYTLQYGGGVERIMNVFGVGQLAAQAIKDNYYRLNNGLYQVSQLAQRRCKQLGFVKYWTGRRRHFMFPESEAHKAFNSVCQGGAFEIVKRAMIRIDEAGLNNDECRMDLQVHDSLRFDIEDGKEHIYLPEIRNIMEDVRPDFGVKFRTDTHRWATNEAYNYELAA